MFIVTPTQNCEHKSPERKNVLFEEHYTKLRGEAPNKKNKPSAKALATTFGADDADALMYSYYEADKVLFRVLIENTVTDIALGEYDSDFNAMSHSTFSKVQQSVSTLDINQLDTPMELIGAFNAKLHLFTAYKRVPLTITLYLPGSQIAVRICGVMF